MTSGELGNSFFEVSIPIFSNWSNHFAEISFVNYLQQATGLLEVVTCPGSVYSSNWWVLK